MDSVIFVVRNVVMDASDDTVTPDAWISVKKYTRHRSNPHQETQIFSDPFDLRVKYKAKNVRCSLSAPAP
jgi:hypothetical protein